MTMHARLKPFDGKRFLRRSYTVFGIKFLGERGWYLVDDGVAEYLRGVVQIDSDPNSAPGFDICTETEAKAIDEKERTAIRRRAAAEAEPTGDTKPMRVHNVARPAAARAARAVSESEGGDLTTGDLKSGKPTAHLEEILGPVDVAPELSGDFDEDMSPAPTKAPTAPAPAEAVEAPPPPAPKKSHHAGGHHTKKKPPPELL